MGHGASLLASVLAPAAEPADVQAEATWVLLVGAAVVFAIVVSLLAWIVWHRRDSRLPDGAHADASGPAALSSRIWIVGGGLVFPVVVLAALYAYALVRTNDSVPGDSPGASAGELVVGVVGHAWWWDVRYRDPAGGAPFALANELHLPAGRAAVIGLESADVIHSFWAPSLAGKVDLVPGRVQQLRVVPRIPGTYRAPCAEFCGVQHARMQLDVVVHAPDAFAAWLRAEAAPAVAATDGPAARGQALFGAEGCAVCHAVRGLFPGGGIGPDLTHVGARRRIGAGTLPADAAGLRAWIAGVQHVKPGARMPAYDRLDAASLDALAAFLAGLR